MFRSDGIIRSEYAQNQSLGACSDRKSQSTFPEHALSKKIWRISRRPLLPLPCPRAFGPAFAHPRLFGLQGFGCHRLLHKKVSGNERRVVQEARRPRGFIFDLKPMQYGFVCFGLKYSCPHCHSIKP
jgi:hypothetical protein